MNASGTDRVIGKSGNRVIEKQSRLTTTKWPRNTRKQQLANSKSKTLPRMNAEKRGSEKDRVIGKSGNRVIEKQSRLTTTMTEEHKEAAISK
jgi:hypothetical protein